MNTPVLSLLLRRFSLRHARLAPRATALLVGILALGVAVFVSIRLANRAAVSSFTHFTDTLTGQSDLIVQAPAGTLPESVLPELRAALGVRPVHIVPVVEATAAEALAAGEAAGFGRKTYTLLGVDLLALANLASQSNVERGYFDQGQAQEVGGRGARGDAAGAGDFWRAFAAGPQVWVSAALAQTPPKSLALVFDERVRTLPVAGVIPTAKDAPRVPANLLVLDLPHLQQITGKVGRVDRVEFLVEPGPRAPERRAELQTLLEKLGGDRWIVTTPGARRESAETMTRAFRLNLTILSLIALLVGLYLIFQALDGAVVRRRTEIAILRSLGVEERAIQLAWLTEAAVLGLLGGALGVVLGWAGAQFAGAGGGADGERALLRDDGRGSIARSAVNFCSGWAWGSAPVWWRAGGRRGWRRARHRRRFCPAGRRRRRAGGGSEALRWVRAVWCWGSRWRNCRRCDSTAAGGFRWRVMRPRFSGFLAAG